ncbi:hypothetical protein [Streptomyces sp. NPDC048248]|uniref:hypothetical protein n=1 Tax=Streptomyces sp. NPDC048248 TaxID=3365523 RepID=UPI0037195F06
MSTIAGASADDPASTANESIRAFMSARPGRPLWPEEQAEYERLLTAWADAVQEPASEPA